MVHTWYLPQLCIFQIPSLAPSATKSHGINHLASGSIFYVGKACSHNCAAVFDKQPVKTFNSTELIINALCPPIIQGQHTRFQGTLNTR